jgi:hypothetical protein
LGYLDLKQICFCLAQGLNKHIQFSKGHLFLDDLKNKKAVPDEVEFSYNLGKNMQIDVQRIKERKKEQNQKQFEELKNKMEQEKFVNKTPKNLTNNKYEKEAESDGSIKDETDDGIENCYDEQNLEEQKLKQQVKPSLAHTINEDLDMDYSQSHLDEFLRSQGAKP